MQILDLVLYLFYFIDHCDMLMSASIGLMHESQGGTSYLGGHDS